VAKHGEWEVGGGSESLMVEVLGVGVGSGEVMFEG